MRLKNSIITKVTLLFIFSSICFILFILYFVASEKAKSDNIIEQRYSNIIYTINELLKYGDNLNNIKKYLNSINFFEEYDKNNNDDIKYISSYESNNLFVNMVKVSEHYYISIMDSEKRLNFLYTDYNESNDYSNYYFIALLAFITLIFFYITVLNSLIPLRELRREVIKFSNGDFDIKTISNNNDEIGKLSEEFTKAAKTINEMNKARILFLRSIMHELKTPITKGFIICEMIEDGKLKYRLDSVFKRLNEIINDFAMLEEINTQKYKINKKEFSLTELMQNVNKMLIIEFERPRNVILKNRDMVILGDFELMSLSVKNLVDNAFKYSTNKLVNIFVENKDLVIQNEGQPFKNGIENYFKPFYSDGVKDTRKGLGLGMYIIKNTIEAQGYKLEHKYQDNCHYFYIKDCIISTMRIKND
ncbi:ArsS family sensor histidine kinase [Helicobacter sp. MIT 14-3879]|uniref:ArsS family sensor histidine kinase n=1 Tax=Helicobacter sp. MIT 14-3879 TaxID=2040649 RepID=UPI000E1F8D1F|nr:ArsS family sensor histidine kinase [Helicobacter sp. MIT 14-3879]RDU63979.1 hypothetical protein CQA44_04890 [Helicobacter sp. MIT 14-3879]